MQKQKHNQKQTSQYMQLIQMKKIESQKIDFDSIQNINYSSDESVSQMHCNFLIGNSLCTFSYGIIFTLTFRDAYRPLEGPRR